MQWMLAVVTKECKEEIFCIRGAAFYLTSVLILSSFCLLLIANTELSLLDNAQAVYMMTAMIMAIAVLLAVVRGSDGFAGERERGTLEPLLAAPLPATGVAQSKLAGILFAWFFLFVLSLPYVWSVGSSGQNLGSAILSLVATGTLVIFTYGALMLALSARMRTLKGVLGVGLLLFLISGVPLVLGPSLRQAGIARLFDWINPLALSLNLVDSVVIDSQGLSSQLVPLTVLGTDALLALLVMHGSVRRVAL